MHGIESIWRNRELSLPLTVVLSVDPISKSTKCSVAFLYRTEFPGLVVCCWFGDRVRSVVVLFSIPFVLNYMFCCSVMSSQSIQDWFYASRLVFRFKIGFTLQEWFYASRLALRFKNGFTLKD